MERHSKLPPPPPPPGDLHLSELIVELILLLAFCLQPSAYVLEVLKKVKLR